MPMFTPKKRQYRLAHDLLIREYGLDLQVPADYVQAPIKADFSWFRKDFNGMSQHLLIAKRSIQVRPI